MPKEIDEQIKDALLQDMDVSKSEKQKMWNQLEQILFVEKKMSPRKHKYHYRYTASSVAALFALFVGLQTEPGVSLVDKVKNVFEAENNAQVATRANVTFHQENEQTPQLRITESPEPVLAEYMVYIDEERYQISETDQGKIIIPKTPLDEKYPEVSMEIRQLPNISVEVAIEQLVDSLRVDYEEISAAEKVEYPNSALMVQGIAGSEWNSNVTKHFVLDNGLGGVFILTQKLFLEAEAVHGVHFNSFLQEFKIIDSHQ